MYELKITENISGGRLDKTVMKYLDQAPKGFVYKMLRKKNIVLNGRKANGQEILRPGDIVVFYLADETIDKFRKHEETKRTPHERKSSITRFSSMIIYEDENIIAVNKPSGLLSQKGSSGQYSINDMLVEYLGKDKLFTPGISNRLDRNTSGIILAGKNPLCVRLLNEAIRDRCMQKLYLVIAAGRFPKDMIMEGYLSKNSSANRSEILDPVHGSGSYIKAAFHVITAMDECSLLSVDLITGRSHQIRAQLSSAGHAVIGDMKYGAGAGEHSKPDPLARRQLLHCARMEMPRMEGPLAYLSGKVFTSPMPDDFKIAGWKPV